MTLFQTSLSRGLAEATGMLIVKARGNGVADDTAAVIAAVGKAFLSGRHLYWPDGTYLTTDSIPNLHSVRHFGPGAIRRGAIDFYPCPDETQTNRLYVSTTGDPANDGLGPGQPVAAIQTVFNAMKNYGPTLNGQWRIILAAGTYSGAAALNQTFTVPSTIRVWIQGPAATHPGVPTAIFDGAGGASYAHGMRFVGMGVYVTLEDVKFQNYVSAGTRIGVSAEHGPDLYTNNVHATACDWNGIYGFNATNLRVEGGILDGCRSGIAVNMSEYTIGYGAANVAEGPIIKNSTQSGVYIGRGSQGHIDYCAIEDNAIGVDIDNAARSHVLANNFKRNAIAVQTTMPVAWFNDANIYNSGTADENTVLFNELNGIADVAIAQISRGRSMIANFAGTITHTGTLTKTVVYTPYTIPSDTFERAGAKYEVVIRGLFGTLMTAGAVIGVDFGASVIALAMTGTPAANAQWEARVIVRSGGKDAQRYWGRLDQHPSVSRLIGASLTTDTDAAIPIAVALTLANTADSITIHDIEVWKIG